MKNKRTARDYFNENQAPYADRLYEHGFRSSSKPAPKAAHIKGILGELWLKAHIQDAVDKAVSDAIEETDIPAGVRCRVSYRKTGKECGVWLWAKSSPGFTFNSKRQRRIFFEIVEAQFCKYGVFMLEPGGKFDIHIMGAESIECENHYFKIGASPSCVSYNTIASRGISEITTGSEVKSAGYWGVC